MLLWVQCNVKARPPVCLPTPLLGIVRQSTMWTRTSLLQLSAWEKNGAFFLKPKKWSFDVECRKETCQARGHGARAPATLALPPQRSCHFAVPFLKNTSSALKPFKSQILFLMFLSRFFPIFFCVGGGDTPKTFLKNCICGSVSLLLKHETHESDKWYIKKSQNN